MQRLRALLEDASSNRGEWEKGFKPVHYKRLTVNFRQADILAEYGAVELESAFGMKPYYTQAVIAGGILSGAYDTVIAVTPSQYGKSYLMSRVALLCAYYGQEISVVGAIANVADIIMQHARKALQNCVADLRRSLSTDKLAKVDKMDGSLSREKISFPGRGSLQSFSLADAYGDLSRNKAVGRGTGYIVDEAANVSDKALAELGRRELSSTDGSRQLLVMISNPHKPGTFYDALTEENPDERTLIVWMDALTAVQEGRWTAEEVLNSEFAKHSDTRQRYWMCELPSEGQGMFAPPKVEDKEVEGYHFLGVDPAYKGKDNLCIADVVFTDEKPHLYVNDVASVKKTPWVDGVTSKDIIDTVTRTFKAVGGRYLCADIGQGIWLVEGLKKTIGDLSQGIVFGASPTKWRVQDKQYAATNAVNQRAEMHLDLQSLLDSEDIVFSRKAWEKVKTVFPYITMERKSNGKVLVRKKEEIKALIGHSPDELDAILLAIHAAIMYMPNQEDYIT